MAKIDITRTELVWPGKYDKDGRLVEVEPGGSLYDSYTDAWKRQYTGVPAMTIKENHGGTHIRLKKVKSKDTDIELAVRQELHALGARYRLHPDDVPGKPDIVHRSARVAVFLDGCFWHGHDNCYRLPKHNAEFWAAKINRNRQRRRQVMLQLRSSGWRILQFWECEIRQDPKAVAAVPKMKKNRRGCFD